MTPIDLRSDTVTLPSPAMREAMYRAELGDDVYGEDPTVNRLEAMAADRMGKEAALFVVSGTMGNLTALLTHCGRGDGAIMGDLSHTFLNEAGGSAALGGVYLRAVPNEPDGTIEPDRIAAAIPSEAGHHPRISLVCLENTHNYCGGTVLERDYMATVAQLARRRSVAVHLDGARIFNAALALRVEPSSLARDADTVMFCVSKGLSAPVGSLLCGSADFIERARRTRRMLGGGMRQAGVIAAAGIVALEEMVDRMQEDHDNARLLAEGIAEIPGLGIDLSRVQTNLVFFDLLDPRMTAEQFAGALEDHGVLILTVTPNRLRAVPHYGIDSGDIGHAVEVMHQVLAA